ncbi:hypothetical protein KI387_019207, partial [Taxus chinensis]
MDSATNNANSNNSNNNWRNELSHDSRQKIVNKIMDTLQRHMPVTGLDGMNELRKIALRFEEKIYAAAVDQQDYLRKISLKMLSLRNHVSRDGNPLAAVSSSSNQKPLDPGLMMPPQLRNTALVNGNGISLPGQAQQQQALLQQNIKPGISAGGMQSSAGLPSTLASMTHLSQSTSGHVFGTQSALNNSTGQVLPQNALLPSVQRQMQSRQQQVAQQHPQPQAQHQLLYQQPLQHQQQHLQHSQQQVLLKENLQQSQLAPSILQQQQQPVMQQSQLQASQQSILQSAQVPTHQTSQQTLIRQSQASVLQPVQQSSLQQPSQSFLQQHQQSVLRQQQSVLQQQQPIIQQQQQSIFNVSNMQTQQQQQLQQIMQSKNSQYQQAQQPSPSLLQPQSQQLQQQPQQQQLLSQLQHQPQQIQQQQTMLPQSNSVQQELQQRLHTPGALLQQQQQQQQQSSVEHQKQLLQAQTQRLSDVPTTSMESSGQTVQSNVLDWQEKIFQKLQKLKDIYFPDLRELLEKLTLKCQQPMAADQLEKLKVYRGKVHRMMQYFQVSKNSIPPAFPEDKIDAVERQIQYVLNSFKPGKPAPQQQKGHQQFPPQSGSHLHSIQQQSQSPIPHIQQPEKHANQLQQLNLQASATSMQPNSVTPIQHSSMPQLQQSGVQTTLQNNRTAMQSGVGLNSTQGSGMGALQQTSFQHGSNNNINGLQQNNATHQQNSINSLQQAGNNPLQQNDLNPLQLNANALQHHHQTIKSQEILQAQQFKNMQHRQMQMQQQQQQFQQQHPQSQQQQYQQQHSQSQQQQFQQQHPQSQQQQFQPQKQQQAAHMQLQQMTQFQQVNDLNSESKPKQASSIKQTFMQPHHTLNQRPVYQQQQQQFKSVPALSVSSPQLILSASPQVSQQSSPQLDQQSLAASSLQIPKLGTPIQPATSPFTAPSPSTLLAPSPLEDSEKPSSAISNIGTGQNLQQTANALSHSQSLAIGTPGISASPLLADFSSSPAQNIVNQDGLQNVSPGLLMEDKINTKEPPFKRLIKVMNLMSPKAFASAVNDIRSVVSLNDRMAGSAPGNGSRAAVGEDLVAMTKCRLQARNLKSQDDSATSKKTGRCISSMPVSTVSSGGSVINSLQQHNNQGSPEMESTATSRIKRPRMEMSHALQDELREINQQLIDTVAVVSEDDNDAAAAAAAAEGRDGIVVKCSYNAIALSPNMKSRYRSSLMTPISPLRLLIPVTYPNCSPVLLDKAPIESGNEYEDLSSRAKMKFHAAVRTLPQPMSLKALAKTWDVCARSTVVEYAHQSGGGSFSS